MSDVVRFGHLTDYYARSSDQILRIVSRAEAAPTDLEFLGLRGTLEAALVWSIVLPSDRVMVKIVPRVAR